MEERSEIVKAGDIMKKKRIIILIVAVIFSCSLVLNGLLIMGGVL